MTAALRDLVATCDRPEVRSQLQGVIAGPATPTWRALLGVLAEFTDAPPRLFSTLTERLATANDEETLALIPVLGSYRTRDAVRVLGHYLPDSVVEDIRSAAMVAIDRLSACDDLPADLRRARQVVAEVETLSESQWRVRLIDAVTARERRTESRRQEAVSQLVSTLRKLHLATPPEGRSGLLATLLESGTPEVRTLGFELVGRELSVSGRLEGPVGAAAITLLRDPDPKVRSSAAVIVRQLAPDGAATAIATAVVAESNPRAAADLLLAAARWPSAEIVQPVIHWITHPGNTADAATEAAWWLFRAGELRGEAAMAVLKVVRDTEPEYLSPSAISLLAGLGDDDDRARLLPLLRSESGGVRQAVGEALLWYGEFTSELLDAASSDPDLFDIACRAVLVSEPTEAGVRRLLGLPKPSPDIANPTLLRTANGLTAPELLDISRIVEDLSIRRGLLELLVSPRRIMSERADPARLNAICEGVVDLADLELSENQPEAALAALDSTGDIQAETHAAKLVALRSTALLALGHVDLASNLQAPCEAWLRGLYLATETEAGVKIVEAMEARFGSSMTADERTAFQKLKKDVAAAEEARQAAQRPKSGG